MKDNLAIFFYLILWSLVFSSFFFLPPCSSPVQAQSMEAYEVPTVPTYVLVNPPMSIPPETAAITPVVIGQRINTPGVLYNNEANSWLQSEYKRLNAAWFVEAETRILLLQAWSIRELNLMHNAAIHNEQVLNLRIASLQQDSDELSVLNQELSKKVGWTKRERFVLAVSSVGAVVLGVLVGYTVGSLHSL